MRKTGVKPKLTDRQQRTLTKKYLTTDVSQMELAAKYGISQTLVRVYINRHREEVENEIKR